MNVKGIRDMRKTSIEKVIDRHPCTNAEAQTFLKMRGTPLWMPQVVLRVTKPKIENEIHDSNAAQ